MLAYSSHGLRRSRAVFLTSRRPTYRDHLINVAHLRSLTINQRLEAIRCLCRWAGSQGLLKSNPAEAVKSLRIDKRRRPSGMTEPEVHGLLGVAGESKRGHAKRNYCLLQLLLQTGLRVGEVTSLKVGDVQIRDRSGEVQVLEGKSNKGREVPLNASARRARAYLQLRPKAQPDEPLFLSDRQRAFSSRAIQTLLNAWHGGPGATGKLSHRDGGLDRGSK